MARSRVPVAHSRVAVAHSRAAVETALWAPPSLPLPPTAPGREQEQVVVWLLVQILLLLWVAWREEGVVVELSSLALDWVCWLEGQVC